MKGNYVTMKKQSNPLTKYLLLGLTVMCLLLIFFTNRSKQNVSLAEKGISSIIIPMQKGVNALSDWIKEQIHFVTHIRQLDTMNEALEEEVAKLRYENKMLQQDKIELDRLRGLYQLDKKYPEYPKIGAQVMGEDPGNWNWYRIFLIDKGTKDGLMDNMIVMAGNGLVGYIIEVGPNYSKVKSIIDDTSNVSAKILRTSDLCNVNGGNLYTEKGLLKVDYIDNDANIVVGDEVVTSHLGDIYPPGIMIGTIKEIKEDNSKLVKYAILEPVVDFKHLEQVLVINQVWKEKQ